MTDEPFHDDLTDGECERLFAAEQHGSSPVDALLSALRVSNQGSAPGEQAALREFRAFHRRPASGLGRLSGRLSGWAAAFSLAGGVVVAGGVAAAATGHLPSAVKTITNDLFGSGSSPGRTTPTPAATPAGSGGRPSTPTPSAPTVTPTATDGVHGLVVPGSQHPGRSGHAQHPTYPTHPAHPTHTVAPTYPAHPTKKPHPTRNPYGPKT